MTGSPEFLRLKALGNSPGNPTAVKSFRGCSELQRLLRAPGNLEKVPDGTDGRVGAPQSAWEAVSGLQIIKATVRCPALPVFVILTWKALGAPGSPSESPGAVAPARRSPPGRQEAAVEEG